VRAAEHVAIDRGNGSGRLPRHRDRLSRRNPRRRLRG
jgi:hypothetical protein